MNGNNQEIYFKDIKRWPRRDQVLLLKAALFHGACAFDAWEEWRALIALDDLDPASRQLLPLLYHNLNSQGIRDSTLSRMKGVYRSVWYKNQLLFQNMAILLENFHNAGIQTMLLKGSAMILKYYQNYGIRTMSDFDVLIHPAQAIIARELLKKMEWNPIYEHKTENLNSYYALQPSLNFKSETDLNIDLHWHIFPMCLSENADEELWKSSLPITFNLLSTSVLNPSDQLLHVCVHGQMESPRLFRWIPDAITILNKTGADFDWDRLYQQAYKLRLILFLREALRYLIQSFETPIPSYVIIKLDQARVSGMERLEYWFTTQPVGLLGDFPKIWFRYLRFYHLYESGPIKLRTGGFIKFLQTYWGLQKTSSLPGFIFDKGINRLRHQVTKSSSSL